jgi:CubicO group peptidase (beta-lactamase class C family)
VLPPANKKIPTPTLIANDRLVQGFSSTRLAHLTKVMQSQVEAGMFPGAVTAILHRNQLVHFEAHGYLDAALSQPMTKDALFRLASMTKPLVTTVAMMMVEQGVFSLQDPIIRWLPELKDLVVETPEGDVPLARPIWVQDLMRHTSGFVYSGMTQSPRIKALYEQHNIESRVDDISADEMLRNLGKIPLAHQPGTFWEYSISVDVLGLLLERVLDQPLDVIVARALLEPLGMKDTVWWVTHEQEKKLAQTLDDDPLKVGMLKSYRQHYNPAGKSYFKGGAGLIGSTADYLRYLQMMINQGEFEGKRYLSRKSVELMLSQHTVGMAGTTIANTGPGYGFGLGFAIRQGQGMGWVPGSTNDAMWAGVWGTSFWLDPTEKLAAVIMAQGPTHKTHTRMLFKNLVYGALVGD